jgi:hypothetical protein
MVPLLSVKLAFEEVQMVANVARFVVTGLLFLAGPRAEAKEPAPKPLADLRIREMTSMGADGVVYRALLGFAEIYPFLVVEKVRPGEDEADEPVLVERWRLADMKGGAGFEHAFEGDQISRVRWKGDKLEFAFFGSPGQAVDRKGLEGHLTCVVSGIRKSQPAVTCRSAGR